VTCFLIPRTKNSKVQAKRLQPLYPSPQATPRTALPQPPPKCATHEISKYCIKIAGSKAESPAWGLMEHTQRGEGLQESKKTPAGRPPHAPHAPAPKGPVNPCPPRESHLKDVFSRLRMAPGRLGPPLSIGQAGPRCRRCNRQAVARRWDAPISPWKAHLGASQERAPAGFRSHSLHKPDQYDHIVCAQWYTGTGEP
jgi:hypothetical protein